tara:strand:- start:6819 stop:7757 length:939 start_codon:yes stop_codon:yes gene_type:complete
VYQEHFGLKTPPFGLTPDTHFFFALASHQAALNMLMVALRSGEGFLKVTGEVGLGKTTVCRMLMRNLASDTTAKWATAYLPNPTRSRGALISMVAEELGCQTDPANRQESEFLLAHIQKKLLANAESGIRTVLIVDEAQALADEVLEALRLLTNLETEHDKLLQLVLFAQPELDQRLKQPQLRQLRQRISFAHQITPLSAAEFRAYVDHRIMVAGGAPLLFPRRVVDLICGACGGVPRLGNILCHKALMAAFGPGHATVSLRDAMAAIEDTEGARIQIWQWPVILVREYGAMLALAVSLGFAVALMISILRS